MWRRLEPVGLALLAVFLLGVPLLVEATTTGLGAGDALASMCLVASGLSLIWWRTHPQYVAVVGPALSLLTAGIGLDVPVTVLLYLMAFAALTASAFEGREAWPAALGFVAYLALLYALTGDRTIGPLMVAMPGYLAGTVLRLRRETAAALADRGAELERENRLLTELAVRNERTRIAAELHDIVGHALSVMVIQAAAGQRLVDRDPVAAQASIEAIGESARQGRADLDRLVDLLGDSDAKGEDLARVEEMAERAVRAGLEVTCRWEGDLDGMSAEAAHVTFRVVQEGLTNALRYAPGSRVGVLVRGEGHHELRASVTNDLPAQPAADLAGMGSGRGLVGLRERVLGVGGTFAAGPCPGGGWRVEVRLPKGVRTAGV